MDPFDQMSDDPFDRMSDRQVTWLDILATFIIVAFILGSFAFFSQFAGSPQNGRQPLLSGSEGAVFDGPPPIAPGAADAEEDGRERRLVGWR
jgi:hypothetical protein